MKYLIPILGCLLIMMPAGVRTDPAISDPSHVPILMYHRIGPRPNRYRVTPENLRKSLLLLYDAGYSTVSLEEYVTGDLSGLPPGKRPVILTFDDGASGQIDYIKTADVPALDPDCALAIILEFEASHPDFGRNATFFIHLRGVPFGQEEFVADKINLIMSLGMEVGNHTMNHRNIRGLPDDRIAREIMGFQTELKNLIGPRADSVKFFAYPLGSILPNGRAKKLFPTVTYEGDSHTFSAAFHAWKGPAPYPLTEKLRWKIPRIEAGNRLPAALLKTDTKARIAFEYSDK